ncbi:MAG: Crp/Fnr family transcriptional regulator [Pseudomonadales bacterium]
MYEISGFCQNRLLAGLPVAVQDRIFPQLECVSLTSAKWLFKPSEAVSHVLFPIDSVVSMLYPTMDGQETETAVIGNEGMVGISLFMGGEVTNSRTVVQSSGSAWRMPGHIFKRELNHHRELEYLLLRYSQYLITQMSQTAVCNRFHSIYQQLCRRLLMAVDRVSHNRLRMTHQLIASNLGVRREGVTEAACKLQRQGVIEYGRGIVNVLDRSQLEKLCCECYSVVRKEEDRLLSHKYHRAEFQSSTPERIGFTKDSSLKNKYAFKSPGSLSTRGVTCLVKNT